MSYVVVTSGTSDYDSEISLEEALELAKDEMTCVTVIRCASFSKAKDEALGWFSEWLDEESDCRIRQGSGAREVAGLWRYHLPKLLELAKRARFPKDGENLILRGPAVNEFIRIERVS
jgi:hypothetical protein